MGSCLARGVDRLVVFIEVPIFKKGIYPFLGRTFRLERFLPKAGVKPLASDMGSVNFWHGLSGNLDFDSGREYDE
jgi:hypothetical protein